MSSLQTRKVDRDETKRGMFQPILICSWRYVQNWEKSIVEQNYKQKIGKTVEIVKVC